MTDDDEHQLVLMKRLDTWLDLHRDDPDRPPLLQYMGMTVDEFIEWRLRTTFSREDA